MVKLQTFVPTTRDILVGTLSALVAGIGIAACYELKIPGINLQRPTSEMTETVPTVRCTRDILSGTVITIDSLKITREYDEAHVPANSLSDPWIAVERRACRTLKNGDLVNFKDVFPNWMH